MNKTTQDFLAENKAAILKLTPAEIEKHFSLFSKPVQTAISLIEIVENTPGLTYEEIADDLDVSFHTVKAYVLALDLERQVCDRSRPVSAKTGRLKVAVES